MTAETQKDDSAWTTNKKTPEHFRHQNLFLGLHIYVKSVKCDSSKPSFFPKLMEKV